MAFCENCGREVPPEAVACPECGHPTPAAATSTLQYADFWTRFAGALIDGVILIIPSLILSRDVFFGGIVVDFLYHWLLVAYWQGQTVGKRVVGVRVTRPDGTLVDVSVAAARAAMRLVSGFVLLLGFLWAAWDPEKRTWHDMVADTRVYRVS